MPRGRHPCCQRHRATSRSAGWSWLEADINTTAVWGTGDIDPKPIGFEAVRVSVIIDADASADSLDALIRHATLWSPVANTLHNPVHLDVSLAARAVDEAA